MPYSINCMYSSENSTLNTTNTTLYVINRHVHPGYWESILCYLLLIYVVSCAITVNLKRCHMETYREHFMCCCCMLYRDIVSSVFVLILYILFAIIDCFQCKCISNKNSSRIKTFVYTKTKNTKQYTYDKYHQYKFAIHNRIKPMEATMVENSNINTSIVIEGLNENHKTISILIVPMNELVV